MKRLYQFVLKKSSTTKVEEKSKDSEGNEVTVSKEVEVEVEQHVILRKPNRIMFDDAELYYGVILSKGIKAGLLTRALLAKRFSNDGGVMSDDDKEEYADLYLELFENQREIERLSAVKSDNRSEEQKGQFATFVKEGGILKRKIQDFELAQASLFEQTAENRARNKTILWWVLNLSYLTDDNGENPINVFPGDIHEERLSSYDSLEESDDPFYEELLRKLIYYVSYWYVGNAQTEEEFKKLLGELEASGLEDASMEALAQAGDKKEESTEEADPPQKKTAKKKKAKKKVPVEEPPVEEPPVEEPPVEEPPVEEPPVEEPPVEDSGSTEDSQESSDNNA